MKGVSGEGCEKSDIRGGQMQKLTLGRGVIEHWVKHPYGRRNDGIRDAKRLEIASFY